MARLQQSAVLTLPREQAKRYFDDWAEDLKARWLLLGLAESIYRGPGNDKENMAVSSLMHATDYLADRIGYEMNPHPKGMIRFTESEAK